MVRLRWQLVGLYDGSRFVEQQRKKHDTSMTVWLWRVRTQEQYTQRQ